MTVSIRIDGTAEATWRPPAFCRVSWASAALRSLWEPRLDAARDALEDLAILRAAEDGHPRLLFARPASQARLRDLAIRLGVALADLPPRGPRIHDVAAGRAARLALCVGSLEGVPPSSSAKCACEDDESVDPIWRLAQATAGTEPFDEGCGLRLDGGWASNPLLAAIGLRGASVWPRHFDDPDVIAEGATLTDCAERHVRGEALGYLREALSWPTSWTSLHGIAEVKTPIFRFVRNAPPTAERRAVHRIGTARPAGAPRGLGFPFVAPRHARSGS